MAGVLHYADGCASQPQRAVDRLEYLHYLLAVAGACHGGRARGDAFQEMPALVLERFTDFEPGTHDVAVTDLEPIVAVGQWFSRRGLDALFEHAHLFDAVEIVENDAAVAPDHHQLPCFVRIGPAHMDVADDVGAFTPVAEGDEPDILPAVPENLRAHGAHPLWSAVEQVVENGD